MSEVTVGSLAKVLGMPTEKLLEQLAGAGMTFSGPDQVVSSTEKMKLLGFLRRTHGKDEKAAEGEAPKQITLKRRKVEDGDEYFICSEKVKFVYREVYFDKFGLWAAMIARCGGPEKYFGINDMLYDGQRDWLASTKEQDIADALRKVGLKAGMTNEALDACLNDKDMAQAMVTAYQTNATNDKVQGTPTFIIDGQSYSGEMSYADFAKILDEKLND